MDIAYLGFIGAGHSNTHVLVHPEDMPYFVWLVLPNCSNCWWNHARRVHFLSDAQHTALTDFKPLPAWDSGLWIHLSSLAVLSHHLWAQPVSVFWFCSVEVFLFCLLFGGWWVWVGFLLGLGFFWGVGREGSVERTVPTWSPSHIRHAEGCLRALCQ